MNSELNQIMRLAFTGRTCVTCGHKKQIEEFTSGTVTKKACAQCRHTVSVQKTRARNMRARLRSVDRRKAYSKVWRAQNKGKINAYINNKKASDPLYKLSRSLRTLIYQSFKVKQLQKARKTINILGCDIPFFHAHIEQQFIDGMGWHNRELWHIDHIIPLATAHTADDMYKLNHYTNLRPLWAIDNLIKGSAMP